MLIYHADHSALCSLAQNPGTMLTSAMCGPVPCLHLALDQTLRVRRQSRSRNDQSGVPRGQDENMSLALETTEQVSPPCIQLIAIRGRPPHPIFVHTCVPSSVQTILSARKKDAIYDGEDRHPIPPINRTVYFFLWVIAISYLIFWFEYTKPRELHFYHSPCRRILKCMSLAIYVTGQALRFYLVVCGILTRTTIGPLRFAQHAGTVGRMLPTSFLRPLMGFRPRCHVVLRG